MLKVILETNIQSQRIFMIKNRILLLIIFLISAFLHCQEVKNHIITYKTNVVKTEKNEKKSLNKNQSEEKKLVKTYKNVIFEKYIYNIESISQLKIANNNSTYEVEKVIDEDLAKSNARTFFNSITKSKGKIYFNNITNVEIIEKNAFGHNFLIKDKRKKIKWNISKETKKIGKFRCYKANTVLNVRNAIKKNAKEEVIAWFSPDIPIDFGPSIYSGLPGLIMEINIENSFGRIQTVVTKIESNLKNFNLDKPRKGKSINSKEFLQISQKIFEDNYNFEN